MMLSRSFVVGAVKALMSEREFPVRLASIVVKSISSLVPSSYCTQKCPSNDDGSLSVATPSLVCRGGTWSGACIIVSISEPLSLSKRAGS